ncbi:MAG: SDR family NAD(P)-dependent oxidoreductase [Alphaproteobacteria bacterium]|nr:SDR family NAD(P)-dependent oxidoreductase [Alphaproteobacteria bacterium]MCB9791455.1 SDR family NAD(P)-dependent oxidoreductase [Alphaproteobacteria bacterium]
MGTKRFGPRGWTPARLGSLAGKTFLITGTTTGTGFEATRLLLSKGARVVMLNRDLERAAGVMSAMREALGEHVDLLSLRLDLAELASVRRAAEEVLQQVPRIDALICNAAVAQVAVQERTVDGFERHLGVNHLGHFLLCGLLFERIVASAGRVVVVGSLAYRQGLRRIQFEDLDFDANYTPWDAYAQSKLAQMMFAYALQRRVAAAGLDVGVQVCHPGASRTSLIQGEDLSRVVRALWALSSPFIAQSAEKGAWPEVLCATEPELPAETLFGPTRRGELVGAVDATAPQDIVLDREAAERLWALSEERTSFRWRA